MVSCSAAGVGGVEKQVFCHSYHAQFSGYVIARCNSVAEFGDPD
jgi:hypothetical protein